MQLRFLSVLLAAIVGLSGCGSIVSTKPLFSQGTHQFRPGLWVSLDDGCAVPADARTNGWPECAKPFVIAGTIWTTLGDKVGATEPVVSDSEPAILQFEFPPEAAANGKRSSLTYFYAVAKLGTENPIRDMSITVLQCPKASMPGLKLGKRWRYQVGVPENQVGDSDCAATTSDAVLAVARMPLGQPSTRMLWIADAPVK